MNKFEMDVNKRVMEKLAISQEVAERAYQARLEQQQALEKYVIGGESNPTFRFDRLLDALGDKDSANTKQWRNFLKHDLYEKSIPYLAKNPTELYDPAWYMSPEKEKLENILSKYRLTKNMAGNIEAYRRNVQSVADTVSRGRKRPAGLIENVMVGQRDNINRRKEELKNRVDFLKAYVEKAKSRPKSTTVIPEKPAVIPEKPAVIPEKPAVIPEKPANTVPIKQTGAVPPGPATKKPNFISNYIDKMSPTAKKIGIGAGTIGLSLLTKPWRLMRRAFSGQPKPQPGLLNQAGNFISKNPMLAAGGIAGLGALAYGMGRSSNREKQGSLILKNSFEEDVTQKVIEKLACL